MFTVSNLGTAPTGTLALRVNGDFDTVFNACVGTLAPGATCSISMSFGPFTCGAESGAVSVSATPGGTVQATLTGTGGDDALLTITPNLQNYGSVAINTMSAPVTFTVGNNNCLRTAPLTTTITGPDAASFLVVTSGCSAPLDPAASCTLTAAFAPTTAGSKTATLRVSGVPAGYADATLFGTATP